MCGIFGVVGNITLDLTQICLNRLSHRGPDGWGIEQPEGCTLGHRRLAILDLSEAGRQPMSSHCGRFVATYNGEVYNYIELRKDLIAKGHKFRTDTDTEVVIQAFVEWGPSCLDRFNGMWAIAIWDKTERQLFLARDRFGKKPLFWAKTLHGLAFASEMKALFPLLKHKTPHPELTRKSLRIMSYEGGSECLITEINRFPAGHYALSRGEIIKPKRWWHTLDNLVQVPDTFDLQCEKFKELFLSACKLRMRSDVPLGVALSGGLDSSATFCAMSQLEQKKVGKSNWRNAFTAGFPGTPLDETKKASHVANYVGTKINRVPIDPSQIPYTLMKDLWLFEEQHLTLPSPFMQLYRAIRNNGIKVSLDGHGADELLAGYGFDFLHAMYDANPISWWGIANTYRQFLPDHPQFPKVSIPKLIWRHFQNRRHKEPPQAHACSDQSHPAWQEMGYLNRILYHSFHKSILPTLLRNYDRFSMASGVEIRMPFLDHRIVTYCFSLSWQAKLRKGHTKAIARQALSGIMPKAVVWDKVKMGFNAPFADWAQGALKEYFQDTLNSRSFKESDIVDTQLAENRFTALIQTKCPTFVQAQACWTALLPYFWEQAVLKEMGAF